MTTFVERLRSREQLLGYWIALDAPGATEQVATLGWDFLVLDGQHGMIDTAGMLAGILACDAGAGLGSTTAALVRTGANDPALIGRALDAGARGVIVPGVNSADEAAAAVAAGHYARGRSFGPSRSQLRLGADPLGTDAQVCVIVMIETVAGLENAAEIAATDGLDGVFVGPVDLQLALTAAGRGEEFETAVAHLVETVHSAGLPIGLFTVGAEVLAQRLAQGFDFGIAGVDMLDLVATSRSQLNALRDGALSSGVRY